MSDSVKDAPPHRGFTDATVRVANHNRILCERLVWFLGCVDSPPWQGWRDCILGLTCVYRDEGNEVARHTFSINHVLWFGAYSRNVVMIVRHGMATELAI